MSKFLFFSFVVVAAFAKVSAQESFYLTQDGIRYQCVPVTESPTELPSVAPTFEPSLRPTNGPTIAPSVAPSASPTEAPSVAPTIKPSLRPTNGPSIVPSEAPSASPTEAPSLAPSVVPSQNPTFRPSLRPTNGPSIAPTTAAPTSPSIAPSVAPSTAAPTNVRIISTVSTYGGGYGITQNGTNGFVYVAQSFGGNYVVTRIDLTTDTKTAFAGNGQSGYNGDGIKATSATITGNYALIIDANGNLYVTEAGGNRVRMINTDNIISTYYGNGVSASTFGVARTAASVLNPKAMWMDSTGILFVGSNGGSFVSRVGTTAERYAGIVGSAGYSGNGGPATSAVLGGPIAMAGDKNGNVFIAESFNNRVRKVDSNGIISLYAGAGTTTYNGDNIPATSAGLNGIAGLSLDRTAGSYGVLYLTSAINNRLHSISSAGGIIVTVAGTGTAATTGNGGAASAASVNGPMALYVDLNGDILMTASGGIRRVR